MINLRRTRNAGLMIVLALIFSGTVASSAGAATPITATFACCTFSPTSYTQSAGETAQFQNPVEADSVHNVTSNDVASGGKPLFSSGTEVPGGSSAVKGTQYLDAGTYGFFCTIHGSSMSGELVVDNTGTAVPRPAVKLTLPSQKLKKVRNSGKLKVKVKGLTAASGVKLVAKAGKKKLGTLSGLGLSGGSSKTVKIKLSKAGKKALKNKRKVTISVEATVPFGNPTSAKRKLK